MSEDEYYRIKTEEIEDILYSLYVDDNFDEAKIDRAWLELNELKERIQDAESQLDRAIRKTPK